MARLPYCHYTTNPLCIKTAGALIPSAALCEREQIVVPVAIGVRPDIFPVGAVHDGDFGALPAHLGIEGVRPALDGIDHLLPRPLPGGAAEVCDPLVRIVTRLLVDARDLHVGHRIASCGILGKTPGRRPQKAFCRALMVHASEAPLSDREFFVRIPVGVRM